MIINFRVKNFRSYKDEVELSFVSNSKIRSNKDHEVYVNGLSVIKNCGLYGANASGKSNLIKAISFVKKIILGAPIIDNFSFKGCEEEPTSFSIVFSKDNDIFQYSFEIIKRKNVFEFFKVLKESLYKINKTNSELIFDYQNQKMLFSDKVKNKQNINTYIDGYKLISNQLFLTFISMRDKIIEDEEIRNILKTTINFFIHDLVIFSNDDNMNLINSNNIQVISSYLKKFDTGIEDLSFQPCSIEEANQNIPTEFMKQFIFDAKRQGKKRFSIFNRKELIQFEFYNEQVDMKKLVSKHRNIKELFNFESESDGTIRMMYLISILFENSNDEKVYFIDEIERSMHPLLCPKLIKEFQDINMNSKKQLAFTTHFTYLMDECLRRDEIYFCDKNKYGITSLFSLQEFKSRTDSTIRKKYLEGRFGGIPNFKVKI